VNDTAPLKACESQVAVLANVSIIEASFAVLVSQPSTAESFTFSADCPAFPKASETFKSDSLMTTKDERQWYFVRHRQTKTDSMAVAYARYKRQ
jgi:hypothetical protein